MHVAKHPKNMIFGIYVRFCDGMNAAKDIKQEITARYRFFYI